MPEQPRSQKVLPLPELLKKLEDEKFNGQKSEWRKARWGDVDVLCTQDEKNWYYRYNGAIFVQVKGERVAHCYGCGEQIPHKLQRLSIHYAEFGDACAGGGEVITKCIPYCPKCQSEPADSGIKTETIEESFRRECL